MKILTAEYVLPINAEPMNNGAVAIDGKEITAVGDLEELRSSLNFAEVIDLGRAAILPGLVNSHSHLELTSLRGALDPHENDFRSWLLKITELRREMSEDEIMAAALAGAEEGIRSGITCFGDIGRFGRAGMNALLTSGLRGILFQETDFSPDDRTAEKDIEQLRVKFNELQPMQTELVAVGISPHSPYTVSRRLFELIAEFALKENIKITIHAAESKAEDDLLRHGEGFFTTVYEKFGVEWNTPKCSPIEYLEQTGILASKPLLAHCVKTTESDLKTIASFGSSVAHCPKSNAKFGHGIAPLNAFLRQGINVGLGSDSVASNNVCDLIEEARFAALIARTQNGSDHISAKKVLELATLGGAKALGLDDKIGTLEPGKKADIIAVSLENAAQHPIHDVEAALVFSSNARDVKMTMVNGNTLFQSNS